MHAHKHTDTQNHSIHQCLTDLQQLLDERPWALFSRSITSDNEDKMILFFIQQKYENKHELSSVWQQLKYIEGKSQSTQFFQRGFLSNQKRTVSSSKSGSEMYV